jgi:hypothetical protein
MHACGGPQQQEGQTPFRVKLAVQNRPETGWSDTTFASVVHAESLATHQS